MVYTIDCGYGKGTLETKTPFLYTCINETEVFDIIKSKAVLLMIIFIMTLTACGALRDPQTTPKKEMTVSDPNIVVNKADRTLHLYDGEEIAVTMKIALGFTPEGHKQREGDGKTPEGDYAICTRNNRSRFYLSLGISYPNIKDAQKALEDNIITQQQFEQIENAITSNKTPLWNTPLGGEIMIHGHGTRSDWTAGCIAVDDDDMDTLWANCPIGTPVTINP